MTDTIPLSPAAQAVMTAIIEISPAPADEIAATALRAAADQVEAVSIWDKSHAQTGVRWSTNRFRAIAAELEAQ